MAHKEPSKISALMIYDQNRPLEVHIFTSLPLLIEHFQYDFIGEFYNAQQEELLEKKIFEQKDSFIKFSIDQKKLSCFIKDIQITAEETNSQLPPGIHFSENIDISITLLIPTPINTEEISARWLIFPNSLLDLDKAYGKEINPKNYQITSTFVGPQTKTFHNSKDNPSFNWQGEIQHPVELVVDYEDKIITTLSHKKASVYLMAIAIAIAFLIWIFISGSKTKYVAITSLLVMSGIIIITQDLRQIKIIRTAVLPKGTQLKQLISKRLLEVYSSLSSENRESLYKQLQKASTGDFLDNSYQQLHQSLFINTETLKIIDQVTIDKLERLNESKALCQWSISAIVRHMNHIHTKDLSFSAVFNFKVIEKQWLIDDAEILPVYEVAQE